jgi:hypothetical protein
MFNFSRDMSRNRNSSLSKTLKDYTVPFIGLLLIVVLVYSVFSWPDKEDTNINNNDSSNLEYSDSQVSLDGKDTVAYITYENWKKVKIEGDISIWKSEKVSVESWTITIDFPLVAKMKLPKNWEFIYKEDGSFYLESSDLWVEAIKNIEISMKYANVSLWLWSVSSLNQNEVESTIYSISWDISVSNLAEISSNLENGSKIVIKSINSTLNDIELDNYKEDIDDYFKLSSWFKSNGWESFFIEKQDLSTNSTWSLLIKENITSLITFDNITDESYVESSSIDLKWRYSPTKVSKILIDRKEALLNKQLGVFSLEWLILNNKTNDLVIKIFDENGNIVWKKVLTLYLDKVSSNVFNTTKTLVWNGLENYTAKPTDFIVYEPTKTGKITTTSSRITIRWKVLNKNVKSILVNNYSLKSYNGSTWRYHAFVEQWTLKNWVNTYTIQYLDKDWNIVYKEYYSIFKEKTKVSIGITEKRSKETKLISSEVKVN